MAVDTFTIPLTGSSSVKLTDYGAGNKNDTQIVTLTDSGSLSTINLSGFGKSTPTEAGQGPGGNDEVHVDLSGFNDNFTMTLKSVDAGDTVFVTKAISWTNSGNVYTIEYLGSDAAVHTLVVDLNSTNGTGVAGIVITCFAAGTVLATEQGTQTVEQLCVGDRVKCGDGRIRPVRWISRRHVTANEMRAHPEFRPVKIRKDAIAKGMPSVDLYVSQQHRVLISGWKAELLFGEEEVLVPAVYLLNDKDITLDHGAASVTYYHFMFDDHQTVFSNGLETESFFVGSTALDGMRSDARDELLALFPELGADGAAFGQTYRPALKSFEASALMGMSEAWEKARQGSPATP